MREGRTRTGDREGVVSCRDRLRNYAEGIAGSTRRRQTVEVSRGTRCPLWEPGATQVHDLLVVVENGSECDRVACVPGRLCLLHGRSELIAKSPMFNVKGRSCVIMPSLTSTIPEYAPGTVRAGTESTQLASAMSAARRGRVAGVNWHDTCAGRPRHRMVTVVAYPFTEERRAAICMVLPYGKYIDCKPPVRVGGTNHLG